MWINFSVTTKLFVEGYRTFSFTVWILRNTNLIKIIIVTVEYFSCWVFTSVVHNHEVVANLDLFPKSCWIENTLACLACFGWREQYYLLPKSWSLHCCKPLSGWLCSIFTSFLTNTSCRCANISDLLALLALLLERFISAFWVLGVGSWVDSRGLRLCVAKHLLPFLLIEEAHTTIVVFSLTRLCWLQSVQIELLVIVWLVELVADGHVPEQRSHWIERSICKMIFETVCFCLFVTYNRWLCQSLCPYLMFLLLPLIWMILSHSNISCTTFDFVHLIPGLTVLV